MWTSRKATIFCFLLTLFGMQTHLAHADLRDLTLDLPLEIESFEEDDGRDSVHGSKGSSASWDQYFKDHSSLKRVTFGLMMGGGVPLTKNESTPMVPASTLKLVTAASALAHLGENFQFKNSFHADLDPVAQEASGIQFIVSGDPTWGMPFFDSGSEEGRIKSRLQKVIQGLKKNKITKVLGPIDIVSTHAELDRVSRSKGWKNTWMLECMAMMQTSFMMNGNCGSLRVDSITSAHWTTYGVDVPIKMEVKSGGRNQLRLTPNLDYSGRIQSYTVSGVYASPTSHFVNTQGSPVPVHQGTSWLKNIFIKMLAENNVQYFPRQRGRKVLALDVDLSSKRLIEILTTAVRHSINGVMDRIYLQVGDELRLSDASLGSMGILFKLSNGTSDLRKIQIYDGSGLDTRNQVRADTLFRFLSNLKNEKYFQSFLSVLPISGTSGTLAGRLKGSSTVGKVFAKTGTINGIINLAGYYKTPKNVYEPFVILTQSQLSDAAIRGMVDGLVVQFAKQNVR